MLFLWNYKLHYLKHILKGCYFYRHHIFDNLEYCIFLIVNYHQLQTWTPYHQHHIIITKWKKIIMINKNSIMKYFISKYLQLYTLFTCIQCNSYYDWIIIGERENIFYCSYFKIWAFYNKSNIFCIASIFKIRKVHFKRYAALTNIWRHINSNFSFMIW